MVRVYLSIHLRIYLSAILFGGFIIHLFVHFRMHLLVGLLMNVVVIGQISCRQIAMARLPYLPETSQTNLMLM